MSKSDLTQFDYQKMAQLDSDMWRAYYNHQFFRLFLLLVRLMRTQFRFNWFITLRLAYYSGTAAAYYRIKKHKGVNNDSVLRKLVQFYKLVSRNATEAFNYEEAAKLELAWWDIHRRSYKNNTELEQSLANSMAVIYNIAASGLSEYAHYRAEAMILPRHEGDSQPDPIQWETVTRMLNKAWGSLHAAVQKRDNT
jgi:hypothetical protein